MCIPNIIVCTHQMHMAFVHTHTVRSYLHRHQCKVGPHDGVMFVEYVCFRQCIHCILQLAQLDGSSNQHHMSNLHGPSQAVLNIPSYSCTHSVLPICTTQGTRTHAHNRKCCRWLHVTSTYVHSIELYVSAYSTFTYGVVCFWLHVTWKSWRST